MAERGPGGARARADEAGRARGPAHRAAARTRSCSSGARTRRAPPTTSSASRRGSPGPSSAGSSGPSSRGSRTPSSCGSARSTGTPSSRRRACSRPTSPLRARPAPVPRRARSPASRGTSSRPRAASSPRARSSTGSRGGPSGRRRPATAIGALHRHLTGEAHPPGYDYQPTNVVFALFPPLAGRHRGKAARKEAHAERARKEIEPWLEPDPQPPPPGVEALRAPRPPRRAPAACEPARRSRPRARQARLRRAGAGARPPRRTAPSLAFLDGCQRREGAVPPAAARRAATCASCRAAGGEARRSRPAVTTLPHGVAWSPDGKALVALADYDHATASGDARAVARRRRPRRSREGVTFHGFGAHGELGLVAGGRLSVMLPGDAAPRAGRGRGRGGELRPRAVAIPSCGGADGAAVRLVARRSHAAGGELLVAGCDLDGGAAARARAGRRVRLRARERRTSPTRCRAKEGADAPARADGGARSGGRARARRAGVRVRAGRAQPSRSSRDVVPGQAGEPPPRRAGAPGRRARARGGRVPLGAATRRGSPGSRGTTRASARARSARAGRDLAPRTFAQNVSDFEISPDGAPRRVPAAHDARRLLGGPRPRAARRARRPRSRRRRAGRVRLLLLAGRAVALLPDALRPERARPATSSGSRRRGPRPARSPRSIAQGVKSFEFDPRDPGAAPRHLAADGPGRARRRGVGGGASSPRRHRRPARLGARSSGPTRGGSPTSSPHPKRQGVYVAELPR